MQLWWIYLCLSLAAAAAVSRHLARRQNRGVTPWVVWTLLLGGLPAFYLVIWEIFEAPDAGKSPPAPKENCCNEATWSTLADLGHAGSYDFRLGECTVCGNKLMESSYYGTTHVARITEGEAERFQTLTGDERKRALKLWHG